MEPKIIRKDVIAGACGEGYKTAMCNRHLFWIITNKCVSYSNS